MLEALCYVERRAFYYGQKRGGEDAGKDTCGELEGQ